MIILAYNLFEKTPPHIDVSDEQFKRLFPDYTDFMKKDELSNTIFKQGHFFKPMKDLAIVEPLESLIKNNDAKTAVSDRAQ